MRGQSGKVWLPGNFGSAEIASLQRLLAAIDIVFAQRFAVVA